MYSLHASCATCSLNLTSLLSYLNSSSSCFDSVIGSFGRMVACFRYAPTKVHNVYLPPPKLDFGFQHQDWVDREAAEVSSLTSLIKINDIILVLYIRHLCEYLSENIFDFINKRAPLALNLCTSSIVKCGISKHTRSL